MKRFLFLVVAVALLSGCGSTVDTNTDNTETTETTTLGNPDGKDPVNIKNPEEVFTDGDFAMYAENGLAILNLGMEKSLAEERMKNFAEEVGEFEVTYFDKLVRDTEDETKTKMESYVNFISYKGYRNPVYTSKGIYTSGKMGKEEKCSKVEDVIKAYEIDADNESYIVNKMDENNYCIELLYDNEDKRIVSPKDTDLSKVEGKKVARFLINNGFVRSIDFYQKSLE
ncbi:MAG: membrane lipoprotein lipid attachment site-containing protein [Lachnospirales bacterium]